MAPALRVKEWIKGKPVGSFEKGQIYVVEFWATWCLPCKINIPNLSALARKYRHKVTVIGMDVYEHFESINNPLPKVEKFVDSMGRRMDYTVAAEDSNFMEKDWLDATCGNSEGIPRAFVINADGRLAWIGHVINLEKVLPKIVGNTWDIKAALAKRDLDRQLGDLDDSLHFKLAKYSARDENNRDDVRQPDSELVEIDRILQDNPGLKYQPLIGGAAFYCLLKTNPEKAYTFGKAAITAPTYIHDRPSYYIVIDGIDGYQDSLKLPARIYAVGAQAMQAMINNNPYTNLVNFSKYYHKMAGWYWLAGNKPKAKHAMRRAIKTMKRRNKYTREDLLALRQELRHYRKNTPS
jgi:thiol-disulfide isomerase/thioredoxin